MNRRTLLIGQWLFLTVFVFYGCSAQHDAVNPPSEIRTETPVKTLEVVAELPINPGNLTVTADGRLFATVHPFRREDVQLIEITGPRAYQPWPNEA
ncbi:MAG: hypothetical protein KC713_08565, partial [Candidatus Omnitrophica bacterium]|nr:hypothetical protein [Candidatus Omnitrophota bacterium]